MTAMIETWPVVARTEEKAPDPQPCAPEDAELVEKLTRMAGANE